MVDVGDKGISRREAVARVSIRMLPETLEAIQSGKLHKGQAFAAAQLAGIMAAKRTHEMIPLCHHIPLEVVQVDFRPDPVRAVLEIQTRAVTHAQTGVEMEALVAASAAALTIYDMAKAMDRAMTIDALRLVSKNGGRSGEFRRPGEKIWPRS
jgi:cyclic pyranopterin phosphate synthase